MEDYCKNCGEPIIWTQAAISKKSKVLDAHPESRIILNKEGRAQAVMSYTDHDKTCVRAEIKAE